MSTRILRYALTEQKSYLSWIFQAISFRSTYGGRKKNLASNGAPLIQACSLANEIPYFMQPPNGMPSHPSYYFRRSGSQVQSYFGSRKPLILDQLLVGTREIGTDRYTRADPWARGHVGAMLGLTAAARQFSNRDTLHSPLRNVQNT
ncbi:uncharacterized protein N7529_008312 [Penicillium soppii]|jgi:hypothetical protein|uniref:uncharacterized protein n=1 Tax=Penicillium soppii TaxID=69789 RepID=UPI0025487981|nr:uncharacterized protein N7529_008312 [Penicillium soppii]KAJ5861002.1 hypothetical protein N7529_008312 [Penicillium soppii]